MANPEAFAENFEAKETRIAEEFPQVITVFKAPMRADQRSGVELGSGTFVEFMVVHPGAFTAQVRVDHGGYWVLSRQTFRPSSDATDSNPKLNPFPSEQEQRALLAQFGAEVDRTRSVLGALIAK